MHIKTIKGKKYYYESKRVGSRVTSVYIGPVDRIGKERRSLDDESDTSEEEFYVG